MKNGFKMIMLVAAIALQPAISFAQKKKITLDGKVFDVQLKDDAKKDGKPITDELTFRSGKARSTYLADKGGFGDAKLKITEDSSYVDEDTKQEVMKMTFEGEAMSSDNNKFVLYWTGEVDGEDITGTLVWGTGGDKVKKSYTYSGSLRGKKKKK